VEVNSEDILSTFDFLWLNLTNDKVIQWLKVLRLKIRLTLQFFIGEVQKTSVCQDDESGVPLVKERALLLLLEHADLANTTEVVLDDSLSQARVSLLSLVPETPVTHQEFLKLHGLSLLHGIHEHILIVNSLIVDDV